MAPRPALAPHRGLSVLVLGILGVVVCFICGIIAWVMGNRDLQEMNAGRMDPAGRGMTDAGRICGIVGTCLGAFGMVMGFVWMIIMVFVMTQVATSAKNAAAKQQQQQQSTTAPATQGQPGPTNPP